MRAMSLDILAEAGGRIVNLVVEAVESCHGYRARF